MLSRVAGWGPASKPGLNTMRASRHPNLFGWYWVYPNMRKTGYPWAASQQASARPRSSSSLVLPSDGPGQVPSNSSAIYSMSFGFLLASDLSALFINCLPKTPRKTGYRYRPTLRHFRARTVFGPLMAAIILTTLGATANAETVPVTVDHVACLTIEAHDRFSRAINTQDRVQAQLLLNSLQCVYIRGRQYRPIKRVGTKMQVRVYGRVGSMLLWIANNQTE